MTRHETPSSTQKDAGNDQLDWSALGLALRLGYTIAIPLVAFALAGRLLDKWLGTTPFLLVAGIVLSLITSTVLIYRLVTPIMEAAASETKKKQ